MAIKLNTMKKITKATKLNTTVGSTGSANGNSAVTTMMKIHIYSVNKNAF